MTTKVEVKVTRWSDDVTIPWQVIAGSSMTGGQFLLGEARIEPGAPCPPLHVHEKDWESLYCIEGVFTVEIDGERFELQPGDCIVMPPGLPHRFANLGDSPVRLFGAVAPVGIEAMFFAEEEYFSSLDGAEPDPARIAEIIEPFGITVLGPPLT